MEGLAVLEIIKSKFVIIGITKTLSILLMKKLLFVFLLFFYHQINAQNFEKIFSLSSGNNTNEYGNAAIRLPGGNFLIGINNKILCLSPNGDSLWTKTYNNYGNVEKLFFNAGNELLVATTKGKMLILKINPLNGDSIGSIALPSQPLNSGYTIYDMIELPGGDIVYCYNLGGGIGGIIRRFTPGQTTNKWSNDYAGENWGPRNILLDDTTLVIAGYKGTSLNSSLVVRKLGISNTPVWNKEMPRGTYYVDRKLGVQKNASGEYLVATSFNMFDVLCPTVVKLSGGGDSLGASWVANFSGNVVNHGYCTSLAPAPGGFYAAGYLNYNQINPDNVVDGLGFMSVFLINDNGQFSQAWAYNKVGHYQFSPGSPYDGSEAWGNGCFATDNGKYLLYGVGHRIHDPGTGANYQAQWRAYVVQHDTLGSVSSIEGPEKNLSEIILFPNPAKDIFYVKGNSGQQNADLKIYDIEGRILRSLASYDFKSGIDLSRLQPGIYIVELGFSGRREMLRLVKQ